MKCRRVLIADDDPGMRAALEARFGRRGWQVDLAVNGSEALAKYRASLHPLVITDVRMPGLDGFALMRELQQPLIRDLGTRVAGARSSATQTAVILLTAYGCVPDAVEAMRNGACDYGKIGDWIEKLGFASEQEVTAALALQWGCPIASNFDRAMIYSQCGIPFPVLEAFCMFPFNYAASTNTLYLAFGERVDHGALYAIERILDCRTQPGVAPRKIILRQLETMRQMPRPTEVEFGPMNDLSEMARIASSYTYRLSPSHVNLTRIGRFIWLRLDLNREPAKLAKSNSQTNVNLIFRLPAEPQHPLAIRRVERIPTSVQLR